MKRIVIIGNSAAGIAAAETIRAIDKESPITILSEEATPAYERFKILKLLASKVKERELVWRNADFYKNNALDLRLEAQVVELNLHKKKAILKDDTFVAFDVLLLATGRKTMLPKIKGTQKEGVVAFNSLKDVKYVIDNLPVAHTVVVIGSGLIAEEIARIIAEKKIEVKFFGVLSGPIEGVDAIVDHSVIEILGEAEAKAVRLSNQKVIGASLVIFAGAPEPCLDLVRDTEIKAEQGVLVDDTMRTSVDFVLAAGDVARVAGREKIYGWDQAVAEGRLAGGTICQM
jgi:NAD(P)H-nitrite reductase large subunit